MQKLIQHYKSVALGVVGVASYLVDDVNSFVSDHLPINGKPLAIITLIAVVILYEIIKDLDSKGKDRYNELRHALDKGLLIQSVNTMYDSVERSGNKTITNEFIKLEINDLEDRRKALDVNSYTQGKLKNLLDKIEKI